MSRRERMQMKAWVSMLGLVLLVFLFVGRLFIVMKDSEEKEPAPESHVPVVEKLSNVWLIEVGEDNLLLYRDGVEESYD
ncbi:MAG: hypothetical protein K2O57_00895, partial [Acetatifactor sp.]|nr:hypothetical protein [Acetatifactor sp.]